MIYRERERERGREGERERQREKERGRERATEREGERERESDRERGSELDRNASSTDMSSAPRTVVQMISRNVALQRANPAQISQSRPDSGLGFQRKVLKIS